MSSPNDPQPPAEPVVRAQPATQEIPVVAHAAPAQQLPPHPGATTPAPVHNAQATGPVTFVPGPPGQLPPPPLPPTVVSGASVAEPAPAPPAADPAPPAGGTASWPTSLDTGPVPLPDQERQPEAKAPRAPLDRTALLGLGLVAAALLLLELGLGLRFGGESFWSDIPLWSAFATVSAVLGLAGSAALLPGGRRLDAATGWRIAAGGLVGLAAFWVLVVLPVVASDRGFLLTAALGCLGAALWVGPARKG